VTDQTGLTAKPARSSPRAKDCIDPTERYAIVGADAFVRPRERTEQPRTNASGTSARIGTEVQGKIKVREESNWLQKRGDVPAN
jgi:hypothetical protein